MTYFLRKIGFYVVALWAALTLNFIIPGSCPATRWTSCSPSSSSAAPVTPATRQAYELLLGGDSSEPLLSQYGHYLVNLSRGHLGVSVSYFPAPVTEVIGQFAAVDDRPGRHRDDHGRVHRRRPRGLRRVEARLLARLVRAGHHDAPAVPYFWLALILLYVFGTGLRLFPRRAATTSADARLQLGLPRLGAYYGVLPALTIVLSSLGGWLLGMRNMMVSTLSEDYIVTAEAKGLRRRRPADLRGPQRGAAVGRRLRDLARLRRGRLDRHRAGLLVPGHRLDAAVRRDEQRLRAHAGHLPGHHPGGARREPPRRPAVRIIDPRTRARS